MPFSQIIEQVVDVARRSATAADADLRRRHRRFPFVDAVEGPDPLDASEATALKRLLAGLPAEQVLALAYLMALGRGQIDAGKASGAVGHMRSTFGTPQAAARRMAGRAGLAEDLTEGLAELARAGIRADQLVPAAGRRPAAKVKRAGPRVAPVAR